MDILVKKEHIMNNLYLIIGENKEEIDFSILNILRKIDYTEDNKITYDLNVNSLSDILDEASMMSLFSNTKVILGDNLDISKLSDNDIEYLSKYITNINKNSYIILIAKKVDARVKTYKIFKDNFTIIDIDKTDNSDKLFEYVKSLVAEKKYKMADSDIRYFLERIGNNINNINVELEKLFIYKIEEKNITIKDIELLIPESIDSVIYEFTNAFLEDDTNKTIKMYNNFKIQNISYDYLITSIANTLRQALIIKMLHNDNISNLEISKKIGKKEFYVKKMLERIYKYSEKDLEKYITKLATIDKNYKSGLANIDELELFIIDKDR